MIRITKSANCMKVIWGEAAPKKKNVKTAATGGTAAMPSQKQKAGITKTSRKAFAKRGNPAP
jgi:L-asparaginase/Glu-tRNA(Gln) amidotransferase subunit D